jgi:4-hydroxybenzoyl-CoA reductase subunit beta
VLRLPRARADAGDDAMYVAGGTDLWPNMKRRQMTPATVIALSRIKEIAEIRMADDGGLTIGAGASLEAVARHPLVRAKYGAVAHAAEVVSTPTLRHMGTIGGNLLLDTRCNYYDQTEEWRRSIDYCMKKDGTICWVAPSSPRCWAVQSSDGVPVAVAIGASVTLASPRGERTVRAADLYANDGIAYLTKQPDELLVSYHLPAPNGWRATYLKLRRRGSFDFPVLGVAAWVSRANDGTVKAARIVLGAVASHPQEIPEAAAAIVGSRLEVNAIAAAADAAYRPAKPMDNTDYTLAWRKEMVRVHVQRALAEIAASR